MAGTAAAVSDRCGCLSRAVHETARNRHSRAPLTTTSRPKKRLAVGRQFGFSAAAGSRGDSCASEALCLEKAADRVALDAQTDHAALPVDLLDRVRRHEAAAAREQA